MKRIIHVHGLPGSGKTTLAQMLQSILGSVWINADFVRQNINKDLGFSIEDRVEQARRMAHLCNMVLNGSNVETVIVDFVNPTDETREAFAHTVQYPMIPIWMDTLPDYKSRFADTNALYVHPEGFPLTVSAFVVCGWKTNEQLKIVAEDFVRLNNLTRQT